MVTNVGQIEYVVDADTSPLLQAEKMVDKTTKAMEKDFKRTDQSVKNVNVQMKQLPKSVKAANQSMGMLGRKAGMASIQVQQLVGQVTMGQNAFVALSQQAADLGFVLGVPLLGAIVSIAAALAGPAITALLGAEDATEELEMAMESLNKVIDISDGKIEGLSKSLMRLAKVNILAAEIELTKALLDAEKAIAAADKQINEFFADVAGGQTDLNRAVKTVEQYGDRLDRAFSFAQKQGGVVLRTFGAYTDVVENLSDELGITESEARKLFKAFADNQITQTQDSYENLVNTISNLSSTYGTTNERLVEFAAGVNTSTSSVRTANAAIQELEASLDNLGEATKVDLVDVPKLKTTIEFDKPVDVPKLDAEVVSFQGANDEIRELGANLNATGQAFGNFSQAAQAGGRKTFEAYKRLAQANAIISAASSVLLTLADASIPSTAARVGLSTSIAALAGAQVGIIEKQTYSGRAQGGPVSGGTPYRVGEAGPEIFTDKNRSYLIPGEGGQVTPFGDGGGMNVTINSYGTPQEIVGSPVVTKEGVMIQINDAVNGLRKEINTDLSTGRGDTANSLQKGFNVERKLR